MKTLKVSELTQEQHEEDVEIVLLADHEAALDRAYFIADDEKRVLEEVAKLSDSQLIWYSNSTPFRFICRAERARRDYLREPKP